MLVTEGSCGTSVLVVLLSHGILSICLSLYCLKRSKFLMSLLYNVNVSQVYRSVERTTAQNTIIFVSMISARLLNTQALRQLTEGRVDCLDSVFHIFFMCGVGCEDAPQEMGIDLLPPKVGY